VVRPGSRASVSASVRSSRTQPVDRHEGLGAQPAPLGLCGGQGRGNLTMRQRAARQGPALSAVFQRQYRQAGLHKRQARRPDDAARAPGAIDHDRPVIRGERIPAMGGLAIGHGSRAGDGHLGEFDGGAAVEQLKGPLLAPPCLESRWTDGGDVPFLLDQFAQRLAWQVHALEQGVAGGRPGGAPPSIQSISA
jgi:hypothetical protein